MCADGLLCRSFAVVHACTFLITPFLRLHRAAHRHLLLLLASYSILPGLYRCFCVFTGETQDGAEESGAAKAAKSLMR